MRPLGASDLDVFRAIARHRSFRRAAIELGVTPSALSHALRALEERAGLRLVNRTTRSVALTEVGEQLYTRIDPAFRDIEDALADLDAFRGEPVGTLRINAPHHAASDVLLPVVVRFMERHPQVRVEIVIDDDLIDVVSAGFDAGIRFGERVAGDMVAVAIGPRQCSAIVAAPTYFARHPPPRTPHDLRRHSCIRMRFRRGLLYRWELERDGKEIEVDVDGPLTLGDHALIVEAAIAGAGLAYVMESAVRAPLADGRLVRVLEDWCAPYPGYYLYYPSRRQLPGPLRAFVDCVREQTAASAPH